MNVRDFYWNDDCRHFKGGTPCKFWSTCVDCNHYEPVKEHWLIAMLGFYGDLLLASPLTYKIKQENPEAHITWLVDEKYSEILALNPYIDQVLTFGWESSLVIESYNFDKVVSFEREPAVAALIDKIPATNKSGLAFGGYKNSLYPLDKSAIHFFRMNIWNEYRTQINNKTWTELYFEVAGFEYNEEPYILEFNDDIRLSTFEAIGTNEDYINFNLGGSLNTKRWPLQNWIELGKRFLYEKKRILITGGPDVYTDCSTLCEVLNDYDQSENVIFPKLTVSEFCFAVKSCILVITGDSLGFHVSIAHNKPTVVLFGPSNKREVLPKHKENIVTIQSTYSCSPCAHQVICNGVGGCMSVITAESVYTEAYKMISV